MKIIFCTERKKNSTNKYYVYIRSTITNVFNFIITYN